MAERPQVRPLATLIPSVTANPVNQFVEPEVRRSLAGVQLAQVAQSLKEFSPVLQQIAINQTNAEEQRLERIAPGELDRLKITNQQQLKQLVAEGKLPETANPWFLHRLGTLVAERQAKRIGLDAFNSYLQDASIRQSNSPDDVEQYVTEIYAKATQGWGTEELAASSPILSQYREHLLQTHVENRNLQRMDEMRTGYTESLNDVLAGVSPQVIHDAADGNTQAQFILNNAKAAINAHVNELGKGLEWSKVNRLTAEALKERALVTRDYETFEAIMQSVPTTQGHSLADSNAGMMEQVRIEIASRRMADAAQERQQRELEEETTAQDFIGELGTKLADLQRINPNATFADVFKGWTELPAAFTPSQREEILKREVAQIQLEQGVKNLKDQNRQNAITNEAMAKLVNGEVSGTDGLKPYLRSLLEANGVDAVEHLSRFSEWINTPKTRTDFAVEQEAYRLAAEGTLTGKTVLEWTSAGKIGQADFSRLFALTNENGGLFSQRELVSQDAQSLSIGLESEAMDLEGVIDASQLRDISGYKVNADAAVKQYLHSFNDWLSTEEGRNSSAAAKQAKSNELAEAARQSFRNKYKAKAEQEGKRVIAPQLPPPQSRTTEQKVEAANRADPLTASITSEDAGRFKLSMQLPTVPEGLGQFNIPTREEDSEQIAFLNTNVAPIRDFVEISQFAKGNFPGRKVDDASAGIKEGPGQVRIFKNVKAAEKNAPNTNRLGVSYQETLGPVVGDVKAAFDEQVIEAWQVAQAYRKSLQPMVRQAVETFRKLSDTLAARQSAGKLYQTDLEKRRFILAGNTIRTYDLVTAQIGMTADEAKGGVGDDAWQNVRLFANDLDLEKRGDAVAKLFKLSTPEQLNAFVATQRSFFK